MTFWENFNSLCKKIGKKPTPVAKEIGIASSTVSLWKNGNLPTSNNLLQIADYFGVSVDYLLGREESGNSSNTNINNASNGIVNSGDNATIQVNKSEHGNTDARFDEMTTEFLKTFSELQVKDKVKVMNLAFELHGEPNG